MNNNYATHLFFILFASFSIHAGFFQTVSRTLVFQETRQAISALMQQKDRPCSEAIWTEIENYIINGGTVNDVNTQNQSIIAEAIEHRYFSIVSRLLDQPTIDLSINIPFSLLQALDQHQYALLMAQHYAVKKPEESYLNNHLWYAYICLDCVIKWKEQRMKQDILTSDKEITPLTATILQNVSVQLALKSYNSGKEKHSFIKRLLRQSGSIEDDQEAIIATKQQYTENTMQSFLNLTKNSLIITILIMYYWYHTTYSFEAK